MSDAGLLETFPPELRNKIYAMVLVEEDSIKIDKYDNGFQIFYRASDGKPLPRKGKGKVVIRDHHRNPKHRGQFYNSNTEAWEPAASTNTLALLRVNKSIHAEASAIFYGSNKFELRCWNTLGRFLKQIGSSGQHLRYISLSVGGSTTFSTARRVARALSVAKNLPSLRTLEVCHFNFCSSTSGEEEQNLDALIKTCEPLLQRLRTSYTANGLTADAVDVIKIVWPQDRMSLYYGRHAFQNGLTTKESVRHLASDMKSLSLSSREARYASASARAAKARHISKAIPCYCAPGQTDQKNQTLNKMLKAKIAARLDEKLDEKD